MTDDTQPSNYAAIDLGSNSFHMIIAREVHGVMQVIDKHKEMVRLRSGLDEKGNLTPEAFDRSITCLERFGQLIKHIPARNVRAVGTNTLRNANNSREFLQAAKTALGHEIQIIAGQEEARLIYLGVSHGLPKNNEQRLVMDIGGGSTEYIIGKHFSNDHLTSTEMGCVSVSQLFFPDNKVDKNSLNRAVTHCRQILRPHYQNLTKLGWESAIGASGSIKAVGALLLENNWSEKGITLSGMEKLSATLIKAGCVEKAEILGLKEERIPVLLGGLAVLIATFELLKIDVMQVSSNALREGLIFDTLGRIQAKDTRETSIQSLQKWMKVDTQQADSIAKTALHLYDQSHNSWSLRNPDYSYRKLLNWAAKVHELGIALSYKRYRHHSAYILANSELAGFSQQEKQILSVMTLNHRGKIDHEAYNNLPAEHVKKLPYLTLLLRLAARIHRGRENEVITPLIYIEEKKEIRLEFDDGWLETHPLTKLDLSIEADYLEKIGFKLKFE